jgi:hypothetical protein
MTMARRHTARYRSALLSFFLLVPKVQSFSSTSHFSTSLKIPAGTSCSSRAAVTTNDAPGSELFPGKGPYTPLGLTTKEYEKIKKDEAQKLKSMNFGAWGPRFKQDDAPDGNWMVMPSLWTNGVNARWQPQQAPATKNTKRTVARLGAFLRKNGSGFVLGYIVADAIATSFSMWRATDLTLRQALWMILKFDLFKRKSFYIVAMLKSQAAKVTAASALTPIMNECLERMNRRKLWSRRRSIVSVTAASVAALALWAGILLHFATLA